MKVLLPLSMTYGSCQKETQKKFKRQQKEPVYNCSALVMTFQFKPSAPSICGTDLRFLCSKKLQNISQMIDSGVKLHPATLVASLHWFHIPFRLTNPRKITIGSDATGKTTKSQTCMHPNCNQTTRSNQTAIKH